MVRTLEPAVLHQHIHATIAIHIANAEPVSEAIGRDAFRDGVEDPHLERLAPVHPGITKVAITRADEFRFVIADKIDEVRRLV